MLRVAGKRTLAKLNAFDLVVTVAFGSVLATALLSPSTSLSDAAVAFVVLAGAQYAVARLVLRFRPFAQLVRAEPRALVVDGVVDHAALRDHLASGHLAGAAIDVWYRYPSAGEPEPRPSSLPFHELDNVIMTPHCSGCTPELLRRRLAAGPPQLHLAPPDPLRAAGLGLQPPRAHDLRVAPRRRADRARARDPVVLGPAPLPPGRPCLAVQGDDPAPGAGGPREEAP